MSALNDATRRLAVIREMPKPKPGQYLTLDELEDESVVRRDSLGRRTGTRWAGPVERFRGRISLTSPPDGFTEGCWQWDRTHQEHGYGSFFDGRAFLAHRWSYEFFVGPVPDGLVLDHLCRNRGCVNPAHLEPVTIRENNLRGVSPYAIKARATHCIHGHAFDEANTIQRPNGHRGCRVCQRAAEDRRRTSRRKAKA